MSLSVESSPSDLFISLKEEFTYTKCYCEENVWHLCNHVRMQQPENLSSTYAVFISNHHRQIPLWQQKAGHTAPDFLVVWDYHVVFIYKRPEGQSIVYDLDSRLEFPCIFSEYANETFRDDAKLNPRFHRMFRIVSSDVYLSTFASNRSHMLDADGSWLQSPPTYPCICTPESTNNIQEFISMQPDVGVGKVVDFNTFVNDFTWQSLTISALYFVFIYIVACCLCFIGHVRLSLQSCSSMREGFINHFGMARVTSSIK